MSQIVYTELEGFPLRWQNNGTVPIDSRKEESREAKTWNVSTTPSDLRVGASGTGNVVHTSNMVGQIVKNGSNVIKCTALKVYGNKVGAPPNPLRVEIRKVQFSDRIVVQRYAPASSQPEKNLIASQPNYFYCDRVQRSYNLSAGDNTIVTLSPGLPAGRNVVIAFINGNITGIQIFIKRGATTISSTLQTYTAYDYTGMIGIIAVDDNAPENSSYSLVLNVATAGSRTLQVYFVVFQWSSSAISRTSSVVNIPAGSTATIASLTPGYTSNQNVVVGIVGIKNASLTGNAIRIKKDATIVSAVEFGAEQNLMHALLYLDTAPSSSTTYSLEVYNNSSSTIDVEGFLLVLNIPSTYGSTFYTDTAAIALDASPKTFNHALTVDAGTETLCILVMTKNRWGSAVSVTPSIIYKDYTIEHGSFSSIYDVPYHVVICSFLAFRISDPTITVRVTGYVSSDNKFEYKLLCIPLRQIPAQALRTVQAKMEFTVETSIHSIDFQLAKFCDTFQDVTVEVYQNNVLRGTKTISQASLGTTFSTFTTSIVSLKPEDMVIANKTVRLLITTTADYMNGLKLARDNNTYTTVKQYFDGVSWTVENPLSMTVRTYWLAPTDVVVAGGEIAPASVPTTAGWITITMSPAICLRPNEYYVVVVYTIGGDASNYYSIQNSGSAAAFNDPIEVFIKTDNAGSSWTADVGKDLSLTITGVQYTQIYSGVVSGLRKTSLGVITLSLFVKAQTSAGMEFAGFDDYVYAAPVVTSSSSSLTLIEVLKPSDARIRDAPASDTVSWSIWAAGSGLATAVYTQKHIYYVKNPVTPKDFGFTELYLIQARGEEANSLAILNDNIAGALFFRNVGDTFIPPSTVRIPVWKIHVLEGRVTFDLLGVE